MAQALQFLDAKCDSPTVKWLSTTAVASIPLTVGDNAAQGDLRIIFVVCTDTAASLPSGWATNTGWNKFVPASKFTTVDAAF